MKDILDFLKLLADATRLNIIGLLAQQSRSGDELAAILDLKPSTVSHHVTRLQEAGLVAASTQQYYKIYALNADALQQYAHLLTPEVLAQRVHTEETVDAEAYVSQILSRWVKDDRLQGIPRKVQHKRAVFTWMIDKFEPDQRYDEDQVWEIVDTWCHSHYCTELIRLLVNASHFDRLADGSWYWRTDSPLAQQSDFNPKRLPIAQSPDPLKYTATRATLRKRDPEGDYANLKEKVHVPNPDRERKLIAFRLKRNQRYTAAEIDAHIHQYRQDIEDDPAAIRAKMVRDGLLHQEQEQNKEGLYWRDAIG